MDERRNSFHAPKGSDRNCESTPRRGFHFEHVSGSKKEWGSETCNKPEEPKCLCESSAFQNGRHTHIKESAEAERLDGQSGPERCLLCSPNCTGRQEISKVSGGRSAVPVHLPTFWSVMCSLGVYQNNEGNNSMPEAAGSQDDHLHRRYPVDSRGPGDSAGSCCESGVSAGKSGFHCKPGEIVPNTFETDRVSGVRGGFAVKATESARRKNQGCSHVGEKIESPRHNQSNRALTVAGKTECHEPGSGSSPIVLQATSGQPELRAGGVQPGLQCSVRTDPSSKGRAGLVVKSPDHMEREEYDCPSTVFNYRDGCLPHRLGSVLQRDSYRRPLDGRGTELPHKLPRTDCCQICSTNVCQRTDELPSIAKDGQCICSDIYKQDGRDGVPGFDPSCERTLGVVHAEGHNPVSTAPTRCEERNSRCRIPDMCGSVRLETVPSCVSENKCGSGSNRDRPVCISPHKASGEVCELETRSDGMVTRCLLTGLEQTQGLCQPTLESARKSVNSSSGTESQSDLGGSNMEVTSVVSNPSSTVSSGATANSSETGPVSTQPPGSNARDTGATSRVAHLRSRYRQQNISEEASSLLLASWRDKSGKTYDSLFGKWAGWCNKRDTDPISGPVSEVVNFLTELFEEGYQYRSVNNYRSAISSAHDCADGFSIGSHPLVSRLMKGVFNKRPPLPRYTETWKVNTVTEYMQSLGPNEKLSLSMLTMKTVVLMVLVRPARSSDLSKIVVSSLQEKPEGLCFLPESLAKQSRQGREISDFFYPGFPQDELLCPVQCIKAYVSRTASMRGNTRELFIATIRPHEAVAPSTVARWTKTFLEKAGIDTNIFKAHSVRGAAASSAAASGVSMDDILRAADWSTQSTFQKYYYKPLKDNTFGSAVLRSGSEKS